MSHPQLLLVEGKNDAHPIRNLLHQHDISAAFVEEAGDHHDLAIKRVGNVDDFPEAIRKELKVGPDLSALGVVADADQSVSEEWESLWRALHSHDGNGPVPSLPAEGWIGKIPTVEQDEIPAGAWVMPNNDTQGAIEKFLLKLIPPEDILLERAENCLDTIPTDERPFGGDEMKALIRTWLAWQSRPGVPPGTAISAEFFDADADLALRFVDWIRRLFPEIPAAEEG